MKGLRNYWPAASIMVNKSLENKHCPFGGGCFCSFQSLWQHSPGDFSWFTTCGVRLAGNERWLYIHCHSHSCPSEAHASPRPCVATSFTVSASREQKRLVGSDDIVSHRNPKHRYYYVSWAHPSDPTTSSTDTNSFVAFIFMVSFLLSIDLL